MELKLHNYQQQAINFLHAHPYSALFFDMGLGKTSIVLSAINDWLNDYFCNYKILIVTKLEIAKTTWDTEIQKWDNLKSLTISKIVGDKEERLRALNQNASIYNNK